MMSVRNMQRRFKETAKRAIKACLGAENSNRARNIVNHIRFQLFNLKNCKPLKRQFDVLFFYPWCGTWPTVKLVVKELLRKRGDLRLGLVTSCSEAESPDSFFLTGNPRIIKIPERVLYVLYTLPPYKTMFNIFDTRIIYTNVVPGFSAFSTSSKPHLVHALMSMNSLDGVFGDDYFDAYDYILCAGPHHIDSFREWARVHPALLGKRLLPAGYPKLDLMLASHSTKRRPADRSERSTIVYAPTHHYSVNECLASLCHQGEGIINALIAEGYRVIFRPHPVSFSDQDGPVIDRICQFHANNPNFSLDASTDYRESYSSADLMITDLSGTGFTFSFSFCRPTIFFAPDAGAELGLSGLQFDARHRIGALVRDIDELVVKTSELCNRDMTDEIERFRDETVFNVGKSAAYIVDCLEDILSGCEHPEWVRL
jgi:hypothetical protein